MNEAIQVLQNELQSILGIIIIALVIIEWTVLFITKHIKSHKEGVVNIISYLLQSIPYVLLGRIVILGGMLWV